MNQDFQLVTSELNESPAQISNMGPK